MIAVAVPAIERDRYIRLLPRGQKGLPLKSTSRRFWRSATDFTKRLLSLDPCIGGVLWRASDAENVALSKKKHDDEELARERRRFEDPDDGPPPISEFVRNYSDMLIRTVQECLLAVNFAQGRRPSFLSIRVDRERLGHHKDSLKKGIESALDSLGIEADIDWIPRQDDDLLYLPDLVAGIIARSQEPVDWNEMLLDAATLLLLEDKKKQRIRFQNKVPSNAEGSTITGE